jgi:uncharacterized membrane protein
LIDTRAPPPLDAAHIEETIQSIARLRAEHDESATPVQRAIDRVTALIGRPWFLGALTFVAAAWIGLNLLAAALGERPLDPPPFSWLCGAVSLASLYMVVLIVGSQGREDRLAKHRELLNLELAILSEQKTSKAIALLEELRRDSPHIHDRDDDEAAVMAQPARPQSVLDAIKEAPKHIRDPATGS